MRGNLSKPIFVEIKKIIFQPQFIIIIITITIIIIITAIGLLPGGSSPTLVQKKIKIHKTTK